MSTTEHQNGSGTRRPRRRRGGRNRNQNNQNPNQGRNRGGRGRGGRNRDRAPKKQEPQGVVSRFLAWLFPSGEEEKPARERRERQPRENRERRPRREKRFEDSPVDQAPETDEPIEHFDREVADDQPQESRAPREDRGPEAFEIVTPRLYVGNLAYECQESDLFDLFSQHGQVSSCEVVMGRSGRSKGFGFVEMSHLDSAKTAAEALNQSDFQGRQIIVSGAKEK
ncbi:MAG: hypothetical protein AAGK14_12480 [Verrucomicrobiota bacterium]